VARAATITIVEALIIVRVFYVKAGHALVIKVVVTVLALHLRLPRVGQLTTSQGQIQSRSAGAANKPGYAKGDHRRRTSSVRAAVPSPNLLVA
jgi:hypothetical protein